MDINNNIKEVSNLIDEIKAQKNDPYAGGDSKPYSDYYRYEVFIIILLSITVFILMLIIWSSKQSLFDMNGEWLCEDANIVVYGQNSSGFMFKDHNGKVDHAITENDRILIRDCVGMLDRKKACIYFDNGKIWKKYDRL